MSKPLFSPGGVPSQTHRADRHDLRHARRPARASIPHSSRWTYGTGKQSDRTITARIANTIRTEYGIPAVAHLTAQYLDRDQTDEALDMFAQAKVAAVLALRGDPQPRTRAGRRVHARQRPDPLHPPDPSGDDRVRRLLPGMPTRSTRDLDEDISWLKVKVDAGASHLISQLFYDNADYLRFLDKARAAGIDVPIEAGIMPVTNAASVRRMTGMCSSKVPERLATILDRWGDDPNTLKEAGIIYASEQIADLGGPRRGRHPPVHHEPSGRDPPHLAERPGTVLSGSPRGHGHAGRRRGMYIGDMEARQDLTISVRELIHAGLQDLDQARGAFRQLADRGMTADQLTLTLRMLERTCDPDTALTNLVQIVDTQADRDGWLGDTLPDESSFARPDVGARGLGCDGQDDARPSGSGGGPWRSDRCGSRDFDRAPAPRAYPERGGSRSRGCNGPPPPRWIWRRPPRGCAPHTTSQLATIMAEEHDRGPTRSASSRASAACLRTWPTRRSKGRWP